MSYTELKVNLYKYDRNELIKANYKLNLEIKKALKEIDIISKKQFLNFNELFSVCKRYEEVKSLSETLNWLIKEYLPVFNKKVKPVKDKILVSSVNIRTPKGRKCKKDRYLDINKVYTIIDEFKSTGLATFGTECYKIKDEENYVYYVEKDKLVII